MRGLDLNQRPLGYEPIADLHALRRATAQHRKNARLPPPTLAPAVGRWRQFSGRNLVAGLRISVIVISSIGAS